VSPGLLALAASYQTIKPGSQYIVSVAQQPEVIHFSMGSDADAGIEKKF